MRESRTYGSVRGALSNERPYRDPANVSFWHEATDTTASNFRSLLGVLRTWMDFRPPVSRSKLSSRAEGFHLRALPKPYVNLSIHTAPDVRPLP